MKDEIIIPKQIRERLDLEIGKLVYFDFTQVYEEESYQRLFHLSVNVHVNTLVNHELIRIKLNEMFRDKIMIPDEVIVININGFYINCKISPTQSFTSSLMSSRSDLFIASNFNIVSDNGIGKDFVDLNLYDKPYYYDEFQRLKKIMIDARYDSIIQMYLNRSSTETMDKFVKSLECLMMKKKGRYLNNVDNFDGFEDVKDFKDVKIEGRKRSLSENCKQVNQRNERMDRMEDVDRWMEDETNGETGETKPKEDETNRESETNDEPEPVPNFNFSAKTLGIGGLDSQFQELFRRVFMTRILRKDVIDKFKINHVKGVILHGPPGTGKTLIARKLSECLNCVSLKIINGPEIFNKYIGQSESNIREIFKTVGKGLHVVIFDEFDSIGTKRSGKNHEVSGNVVNQILTMMDGVNKLENFIIFGITNKFESLDPALLRPGRFEVHIKIDVPDQMGRKEILEIHTNTFKESLHEDIDFDELSKECEGFSGADLEGLVRNAFSYALNDNVKFNEEGKIENPEDIKNLKIIISREHFKRSLEKKQDNFPVVESMESSGLYLKLEGNGEVKNETGKETGNGELKNEVKISVLDIPGHIIQDNSVIVINRIDKFYLGVNSLEMLAEFIFKCLTRNCKVLGIISDPVRKNQFMSSLNNLIKFKVLLN